MYATKVFLHQVKMFSHNCIVVFNNYEPVAEPSSYREIPITIPLYIQIFGSVSLFLLFTLFSYSYMLFHSSFSFLSLSSKMPIKHLFPDIQLHCDLKLSERHCCYYILSFRSNTEKWGEWWLFVKVIFKLGLGGWLWSFEVCECVLRAGRGMEWNDCSRWGQHFKIIWSLLLPQNEIWFCIWNPRINTITWTWKSRSCKFLGF